MPDQDQRYQGYKVNQNEFVVYDKTNSKAWVQSDYWIDWADLKESS